MSEKTEVSIREQTSLIQVIERAATNPDVNIEKMERLLDMYERIQKRDAEAAFNADFSNLQAELPSISKEGEILVFNKDARKNEVRGNYMKFEDINEVCKPIMQRHGFGVTFQTATVGGKVAVTATLRHRLGHKETNGPLELPADTTGSKNSVQAIGSSVSYGKRYTLCGILNISASGEDDNAQTAVAEADPRRSRSEAVLQRARTPQPRTDAPQTGPVAAQRPTHVQTDAPAAGPLPAGLDGLQLGRVVGDEALAGLTLAELNELADALGIPPVEVTGEDELETEAARGLQIVDIKLAYEAMEPALKEAVTDIEGRFALATNVEREQLVAQTNQIAPALNALGLEQEVLKLKFANAKAKERLRTAS